MPQTIWSDGNLSIQKSDPFISYTCPQSRDQYPSLKNEHKLTFWYFQSEYSIWEFFNNSEKRPNNVETELTASECIVLVIR